MCFLNFHFKATTVPTRTRQQLFLTQLPAYVENEMIIKRNVRNLKVVVGAKPLIVKSSNYFSIFGS